MRKYIEKTINENTKANCIINMKEEHICPTVIYHGLYAIFDEKPVEGLPCLELELEKSDIEKLRKGEIMVKNSSCIKINYSFMQHGSYEFIPATHGCLSIPSGVELAGIKNKDIVSIYEKRYLAGVIRRAFVEELCNKQKE